MHSALSVCRRRWLGAWIASSGSVRVYQQSAARTGRGLGVPGDALSLICVPEALLQLPASVH